MPKGSFLSDTFEKLEELGVSTTKKAGQAVQQTLGPTKLIEHVAGQTEEAETADKQKAAKETQKPTHSSLNLEDLKKKYQDQDKIKENSLRNRLFQLVKSSEEKILTDKKRKEQEKQQKLMYEEQQKKKKAEEKKQQEQATAAPRGKVRRSIFSHKKIAERQQAEVKPSTGKQ